MRKPVFALLGLAAATVAFVPLSAEAQTRTRVGVLDCTVAPGVGLILGSSKQLNCLYTSSRGKYRERYVGAVNRVGLDVGFTDGGRLAWGVFAPSRRGPGALGGTYVGAGAEATLGVGLGANVLVGGSDRTIALQPLSVGAQTGIDLALAVSSIELTPVGTPRRARHSQRHR